MTPDLFLHTERIRLCASWPEQVGFGCLDGSWKKLDKTMHFGMTASCEILCQNVKETGCCYLKEGSGCWWRSGGRSKEGVGSGLSVNCYLTGIYFS